MTIKYSGDATDMRSKLGLGDAATKSAACIVSLTPQPPRHGEFYVYNSSWWSPCNGGKCCGFTVPADVRTIKFEAVGGGDPGGSSGKDYDMGIGGQGGNTAIKTVATKGGCVYTICAASTSMCSCCMNCNHNCRHGCTSYVNGSGLSNFCAKGGTGGYTSWDMNSNCYNCHIGNIQCARGNYNGGWGNCVCNEPGCGYDMIFRGNSGSYNRQYNCCADAFSTQGGPTGPFSSGTGGIGKHWCTGNQACCSSHSTFPGGGGSGHQAGSGNSCWGGFGSGGLIRVTYF